MTCRAKHAPLENLRSRDRSMHVQIGTLQMMCTWISRYHDVNLDIKSFSSRYLRKSACTYFILSKLNGM